MEGLHCEVTLFQVILALALLGEPFAGEMLCCFTLILYVCSPLVLQSDLEFSLSEQGPVCGGGSAGSPGTG